MTCCGVLFWLEWLAFRKFNILRRLQKEEASVIFTDASMSKI